MRAYSAFVVLLVVLPLTACDKPDAATTSATPSNAPPASSESAATEPAPPTPALAPTTSEIIRKDASGFKLGDYLPPLDGGKIEIALPDGWNLLPRDSEYLLRLYRESRSGVPRIDFTVEENNLGGLTTVTEANVAEFTAAVAKELEAKGTAVVEPPIPMVIGSVPCTRYVSHVKLKVGLGTILVERQTLDVLHAGRLYTINLLAYPNKLLDSRDAAYAVCSGIRFPEVEPPAVAEPAAAPEPPPAAAEPPAEKE